MKFFTFFFAAFMPLVLLAQSPPSPPTPDQIQTLQNAIDKLSTDDNTAQTINATVQTDVQAVIAAAQALSTSTSACPTCGKGAGLPNDDAADLSEAISRGFGSRIAIGPYRGVTLAVRRHLANLGTDTDAAWRDSLTASITPNPQRACRVATAAVMFLEIAPAFGITIPNYAQILAIAQQIQAQACGTPVPPVPPTPPVPVPPGPTPARHATGLKLTPLDVRQKLHVRDKLTHAAFHALRGTIPLPPSLDLRGTETPIEDQGSCGSCHDFSAKQVVESANSRVGNLDVTAASDLSAQFLLDVNPNGDGGCSGGDASSVFAWMTQQGGGLPLDSVYGPYQAGSNGSNQLSTTAVGYTLSDWGYADTVTGVASVQAVKTALVAYGPISVCIGAGPIMNYSGGIVTTDLSRGIDHQIIISGYQDDAAVSGGGYWIVRNSWGTGWGEQGYFRVAYSANPTTEAMYGVATKGQTVVVPAGSGPSPNPGPTPTRRASILAEKATRVYKTNAALVEKALKAAEDILQNAQ